MCPAVTSIATKRARKAPIPGDQAAQADEIAEAFVAVCIGYGEQLAIRSDLDPASFTRALMAIVKRYLLRSGWLDAAVD
jgi:hypothetical protein